MCQHIDEWLYCREAEEEYAVALRRVAKLLPRTCRTTDRLARCFLSSGWPEWKDLLLADRFSDAVRALPDRYVAPSLRRHADFLDLICGWMVQERLVDGAAS